MQVLGSFSGFVVVLLLSSALASAFALLLMGLGKTESQVMSVSIPAVLAMSFLGGAWIPAFVMPEWIQTASLALPTRWMMDALHAATWRGMGWDAIWLPSLVMAAFGLVFGLIGIKSFNWND